MNKHLRSIALLMFAVFFFAGCSGQTSTGNKRDSVYTYRPSTPDGIGKYYTGREIAHVMDAAGADWLERSDRQKEEHVEQAIDSLYLHSDDVVADIGAGSGYYTFRIAKKVTDGKVDAVEIQDEFIQQLNVKKTQLHIKNVDVVKGTEQSPDLTDNSVDLAIMVDVYHELKYPHEMLQALRKALKPNGKLLLLEFRAEDASIPIKELHKLSVEQANKELAANGFVLYQQKEFLPIQHFLLYAKANE